MRTHCFAVYLVIQSIRKLRKLLDAIVILHRNFQSSEQIIAAHVFLGVGRGCLICKYRWIHPNPLLKCAYVRNCACLDRLYPEEGETTSPWLNDVSWWDLRWLLQNVHKLKPKYRPFFLLCSFQNKQMFTSMCAHYQYNYCKNNHLRCPVC